MAMISCGVTGLFISFSAGHLVEPEASWGDGFVNLKNLACARKIFLAWYGKEARSEVRRHAHGI